MLLNKPSHAFIQLKNLGNIKPGCTCCALFAFGNTFLQDYCDKEHVLWMSSFYNHMPNIFHVFQNEYGSKVFTMPLANACSSFSLPPETNFLFIHSRNKAWLNQIDCKLILVCLERNTKIQKYSTACKLCLLHITYFFTGHSSYLRFYT